MKEKPNIEQLKCYSKKATEKSGDESIEDTFMIIYLD